MPGDGGDVVTIDLVSRKVLAETDNYKIGSDGKRARIQQDSTYFNPEQVEFYHTRCSTFMRYRFADDGSIL
jgi:hypothetical protein